MFITELGLHCISSLAYDPKFSSGGKLHNLQDGESLPTPLSAAKVFCLTAVKIQVEVCRESCALITIAQCQRKCVRFTRIIIYQTTANTHAFLGE